MKCTGAERVSKDLLVTDRSKVTEAPLELVLDWVYPDPTIFHGTAARDADVGAE